VQLIAGNELRHFVAVVDDQVVGSRTTTRHYAYAVAFKGNAGWFATFHSQLEGANQALYFDSFRHLEKRVVDTIETRDRVPMGATWRPELSIGARQEVSYAE